MAKDTTPDELLKLAKRIRKNANEPTANLQALLVSTGDDGLAHLIHTGVSEANLGNMGYSVLAVVAQQIEGRCCQNCDTTIRASRAAVAAFSAEMNRGGLAIDVSMVPPGARVN